MRWPTQEMEEKRLQSLSQEHALEEEVAAHSSILAWGIPKDRGAWLAAVHWVTNSLTRLSEHALKHTHPLVLNFPPTHSCHHSRLSQNIGLNSLCYTAPSCANVHVSLLPAQFVHFLIKVIPLVSFLVHFCLLSALRHCKWQLVLIMVGLHFLTLLGVRCSFFFNQFPLL